MYPEGFHPIGLELKPDYSGPSEHIPRSVAGVKYYFVDFGISVHIPENIDSRLVTGFLGRDREPPELANQNPRDPLKYDPFKLDVFIIGNMFKHEFYEVRIYSNASRCLN